MKRAKGQLFNVHLSLQTVIDTHYFAQSNVFLIGTTPAFFSFFRSFQTNNTILTANMREKCPSSIWCWDSNPRPLECKSLPITTRPGLPPHNGMLIPRLPIPLPLLINNLASHLYTNALVPRWYL